MKDNLRYPDAGPAEAEGVRQVSLSIVEIAAIASALHCDVGPLGPVLKGIAEKLDPEKELLRDLINLLSGPQPASIGKEFEEGMLKLDEHDAICVLMAIGMTWVRHKAKIPAEDVQALRDVIDRLPLPPLMISRGRKEGVLP
jgi:hypothetical protein